MRKESRGNGKNEFAAKPISPASGCGIDMEGEKTKEFLEVRLNVVNYQGFLALGIIRINGKRDFYSLGKLVDIVHTRERLSGYGRGV